MQRFYPTTLEVASPVPSSHSATVFSSVAPLVNTIRRCVNDEAARKGNISRTASLSYPSPSFESARATQRTRLNFEMAHHAGRSFPLYP